jgi:hypothetical protein
MQRMVPGSQIKSSFLLVKVIVLAVPFGRKNDNILYFSVLMFTEKISISYDTF